MNPREGARQVYESMASRLLSGAGMPQVADLVGLLLLQAALATTGDVSRRRADVHRVLAVAVERELTFGGLISNSVTHLTFATRIARASLDDYHGLLKAADKAIVEGTGQLLGVARSTGAQGTVSHWYDVVSGVSGLGRYLLMAVRFDPDLEPALLDVLRYLVELGQPITVEGKTVPGWWNNPALYISEDDLRLYPDGDFNLGLSHGICGPLSLLAIAALAGWEVDGQRAAIRDMLSWILRWQCVDAVGPYWPGRIPLAAELTGEGAPWSPSYSWCYGSTGVSRTIQLAGEALADDEAAALARTAIRAALDRFEQRIGTGGFGATICHGAAGLLQGRLRILGDAGQEDDAGERTILSGVLDEYSPDHAFGFQHLRPAETDGPLIGVDRAGVVEGAAGVALALLGDEAIRPAETAWDAMLLLS